MRRRARGILSDPFTPWVRDCFKLKGGGGGWRYYACHSLRAVLPRFGFEYESRTGLRIVRGRK